MSSDSNLSINKGRQSMKCFFGRGINRKESCEIDLLFDRADKTISLIEIKYNENGTRVDKKLCEEIRRKQEILSRHLNRKKTIQPVLLTRDRISDTALLEINHIRNISSEDFWNS